MIYVSFNSVGYGAMCDVCEGIGFGGPKKCQKWVDFGSILGSKKS